MEAAAAVLSDLPPPDLTEASRQAGVCLLACNSDSQIFSLVSGNKLFYVQVKESEPTARLVEFEDHEDLPQDVALTKLSFHFSGKQLLVFGAEAAFVVTLPQRGRRVFGLRRIAEDVLSAPNARLLDAQWHPESEGHIGLLVGFGDGATFVLCRSADGLEERLSLSAPLKALSFGAPASCYRFSVWFRDAAGQNYVLCPVVPAGFQPPVLLAPEEDGEEEFADEVTFDEATLEYFRSREPRLQGPLLVPNRKEDFEDEIGDANGSILDMTSTKTNSVGPLASSIPLCVSVSTSGALDFYLAADSVEPSFVDDDDDHENFVDESGPELAAVDAMVLPATSSETKPLVIQDSLDGDALLIAIGGAIMRCELPWKRVLETYISDRRNVPAQANLVPSLISEAVRTRVSFVAALRSEDDILGMCMTESSVLGHVLMIRTSDRIEVVNLTREKCLSKLAAASAAQLSLTGKIEKRTEEGISILDHVSEVNEQIANCIAASPLLLSAESESRDGVLSPEDLVYLVDRKRKLQDEVVTPLRALEARVRVCATELDHMSDLQQKQLENLRNQMLSLADAGAALRERIAILKEENEYLAERATNVLTAAQSLHPQLSDAEKQWKSELLQTQDQLVLDARQVDDLQEEYNDIQRRNEAQKSKVLVESARQQQILNPQSRDLAETLLKAQHGMLRVAASKVKSMSS